MLVSKLRKVILFCKGFAIFDAYFFTFLIKKCEKMTFWAIFLHFTKGIQKKSLFVF